MSDPWQRPPIATAPLSVVLIARAARPDLEEIVTAWAAQLDTLERPYEIILVNDGCAGDTGTRADALTQQLPALRVCHHAEPRGFGAALRTGLAEARHPLLVYAPCDRQFRPEDLKLLLAAIDRVDVVAGCRAGRPVPVWRRWLGAAYRLFVRVLFGLSLTPPLCSPGWSGWGRRRLARLLLGIRVHDPECAFRLLRRSVFRRIPIQADGEFAHIEILAKANFLGHLLDEVAVPHRLPGLDEPVPSGPPPRFWRDLGRLLRAADFGPASLPPEEPPTVLAVEPQPAETPPVPTVEPGP
jgi:glycosyltransferase involved in cell wall biosynthesis